MTIILLNLMLVVGLNSPGMKQLVNRLLLLLVSLLFNYSATAQLYQGEYYNSYGLVTGIVPSGADLWISSLGGLVYHNTINNTDQYLNTLNSGLSYNNINCIVKDNSGNLWIGTGGHGLCRYDGNNWSYWDTTNSLIPDNYIVTLSYDSVNNSVWVGTRNGFVARLSGPVLTLYDSLDFGYPVGLNDINCMLSDKSGRLWFGTKDLGLFRYDGVAWKRFYSSTTIQNNIKSIASDSIGNIYAGSSLNGQNKVCFFDNNTWSVLPVNPPNYVIGQIECVYLDKNQDLWIGTFQYGVYRYTGMSTQHYTPQNSGLISKHIQRICQDSAGNMWFGSGILGRGICSFDGQNWQRDSLTESFYMSNGGGIALERKGAKVFVGGGHGDLSDFNGVDWHRNFAYYRDGSSLFHNMTFNPNSDSLWITTVDSGLVLYANNTFTRFPVLPSHFLGVVNAEKPGTILYSTVEGAIIKFNTLAPGSFLSV